MTVLFNFVCTVVDLCSSFIVYGAQATEYYKFGTEVKAKEILDHIKNGDDIALYNCSIIGELNVSKINLKTVPDPIFYELINKGYTEDIIEDFGLSDKLSLIESKITIINSTFMDNADFSNVQFNSNVNFNDANFASNA